ncbi:MAG TPA: protein-L-isoaspartate(D-aspartate) O-methyltransferase [Methanoregulaceae archaeon]|nr:protein-L-isoaspartate(D-aspartate) O-methyltransferase [Methanoregulaceae archaeon]HOV68047.1 protein-L-isoaspartate(D-aspartate) O-methyltransferase [Methanoregulaceae archaeon]HQJ87778.1 protein-L-isoaspartate(D-aspartate) O-methyltransferase [Methanoregulaceae archaeon]
MVRDPYEPMRLAMVEYQIARRGIHDPRVLDALRQVPRHLFVPPGFEREAYEDSPLPIGQGQTISQPYIVALMTALLDVGPDDRVLEIGAGSGYQAAVLARLAGGVITVERLPEVAAQARRNLERVGVKNVEVVVGDGTRGRPESAPYQGIIVTAAAPRVPPPLLEQLADGGRLVAPVGGRDLQELVRVVRRGGRYEYEHAGPVRFVPLVGEHGW